MRTGLLILLIILLSGCAGSQAAVQSSGLYSNPVLDSDFPDPALVRGEDGLFYAYATQTRRDGEMVNLQVARSPDLVNWTWIGDALPNKPAWAERTQDFWAPHVAFHEGAYYLYYSAKPDAALEDPDRGLCLAVATSVRPEGPFTDVGRPLLCGDGFVNIDPMAYDDPETGRRLLYWGSGFGPIKVRELASDRISFLPESPTVDLITTDPTDHPDNYQRLVEGAWVIRRAGYYYLFYSGDNCCGPNAHYALMVARSRSATGPFETLGEARGTGSSVILEKGGKWVAPGHNGVVEDKAGDQWILYHAVDSEHPSSSADAEPNTRRVMLLDRLVWEGGWPMVEGKRPITGPQPRPALR